MKTQNKSIGKTLIKLFVCIVLFAALLVGVLYLVDKDIFSNDNTVNAVKDNTETTQQNQDQNNNNNTVIEGGLIVDEDVNKTVSSKVIYNNIALSGVNVYVDNKLAVTTDVNGNFTLNTQLGKVIRFDKYGYNINAITVTQDFPSTVVANAKNYVLTIKSNTLNYGISIYAKSSNQSLTYFGDSNSFKVNLHIINGEDYNVTITKENFVKTYNVIFSTQNTSQEIEFNYVEQTTESNNNDNNQSNNNENNHNDNINNNDTDNNSSNDSNNDSNVNENDNANNDNVNQDNNNTEENDNNNQDNNNSSNNEDKGLIDKIGDALGGAVDTLVDGYKKGWDRLFGWL